jgi:NodT family efflux transporter outer membrane factor (OMF) lipoprotein
MLKWISIRTIASCLLLVLLGGCAVFTPPVRDPAPIAMPERFSLYTEADPGPGAWWQGFASTELDRLVTEALSGNFDIRTAAARVAQAEAAARTSGAALLPTLDAEGGAQRSVQQSTTESGASSRTRSTELSAGLASGYELDLWGRLRALRNADLLAYQASRDDLNAAAMTVAADVVNSWVGILSVRRQISILDNQIAMNRRMLDLQKLRFLNGQATVLDVSQQNEALAAAKAILPTLQLEEETQMNALAVLLGRAGRGELSIEPTALPDLPPLPGTGLPADLLASRPDVHAAGLRLAEADWQVTAARADRLPSMNLSANALFSSGAMNLLFSNWVSTLAGSISAPLFDGGSRAAAVESARAGADEYLTAYASAVSTAIREVEDCLVTEKRQTEYLARLQEQLEAARQTLRDAQLQYTNGQDNYLSYLNSWTSVQALERQLVREQATLIQNRVGLYRALGGDWTRNAVPYVSSFN